MTPRDGYTCEWVECLHELARERPRVVLDLVRGVAVAGDRDRMGHGEGDEQRVRGRARRRVLEPAPVSDEARVHGLGSAQSVAVSSGLAIGVQVKVLHKPNRKFGFGPIAVLVQLRAMFSVVRRPSPFHCNIETHMAQ